MFYFNDELGEKVLETRLGTIPLVFLVLLLYSSSAYCDFYTDISHAYAPGEVTELMAGETMLPIIQVEAHSPLPLGTAVILTDPFPSSITLTQGNVLAQLLAEKGWHVVISPVAFTDDEMIKVNPDDTTSDNTPTNQKVDQTTNVAESPPTPTIHPKSNAQTQYIDFENTKATLSIQLNALDALLESRQGYRLYIAQGMVAAAFFDVTQDKPALHPDSLVAISPFWPEATLNKLVVSQLAQSEYPVLDLSLEHFNGWADSTDEKRKISAQNALKIHYRQMKIQKNPLSSHLTYPQKPPYIQLVASSTVGWTRHLGW